MSRLLALVTLSGCALAVQPNAYYGDRWDPPEIGELSVASEEGALGGGTVEISGSGFGDDPTKVVVQFGQHSATILGVRDDLLTVQVPPGPMSGGPVKVDIATPTGFVSADGAYTYDVGDGYANQSAYVQVNNHWESCLGGLSERLDEEHGNLGCSTVAYTGYTGISGVAEAYNFTYPRVHSPYSGFFGGSDAGGGEWRIARPGRLSFPFGVDDLHEDVGPVWFTNALWEGGKPYCVDADGTAVYRYGGGEVGYLDPYSVGGTSVIEGQRRDACEEGELAYDVGRLEFCSSLDAEGVPTNVYDADWPVAENFFAGSKQEITSAEVVMTAPEAGIEGLELVIPENIVVYTTQGIFPPVGDAYATTNIWSIGSTDTCFSGNDGSAERLDDVAVEFIWERSRADLTEGDGVLSARTYVRVTITALTLNWFGTTGYPVRAIIEVPDDHERGSDGFSRLEVPAHVLYQFPTIALPQGGGFGDGLLSSTVTNWGYLVIDFQRITDYTLASDLKGDVLFSYSTGDFGFFGWTNPTEAGECGNCLDDDGDGWFDDRDPDCGTEETGTSGTGCNDGVDNDGDGRIDSGDDDCTDGADDDESNCDNGVDDDGDGYPDQNDPECIAGGFEAAVDTECTDGEDGDGDGWTDSADPDCGTGDQEVGYGASSCNDGVDDDGDGLADVEDPECSTAASSEPATVLGCEDGLDGDLDGWVDAADPDCDVGDEEVDFGTSECNDDIDNDGDVLADGLDPECTDAGDDDEST